MEQTTEADWDPGPGTQLTFSPSRDSVSRRKEQTAEAEHRGVYKKRPLGECSWCPRPNQQASPTVARNRPRDRLESTEH